MKKEQMKTKDLTKMSIMAALVFLATYFIKIPSINGYTHLGDCMIFLSVLILGWRKGALAGGMGAALADLFRGIHAVGYSNVFYKSYNGYDYGIND